MQIEIGKINKIRIEEDQMILDSIPITKDGDCPAIERIKTALELEEEILDMLAGKDTGYHEDHSVPIGKRQPVKYRIIDVPDGTTNNAGTTCQDCDSTTIRRVLVHVNGSVLYFCGKHK